MYGWNMSLINIKTDFEDMLFAVCLLCRVLQIHIHHYIEKRDDYQTQGQIILFSATLEYFTTLWFCIHNLSVLVKKKKRRLYFSFDYQCHLGNWWITAVTKGARIWQIRTHGWVTKTKRRQKSFRHPWVHRCSHHVQLWATVLWKLKQTWH